MGGDKYSFSTCSPEDESVMEDDFLKQPFCSSSFFDESDLDNFEVKMKFSKERKSCLIYDEIIRGYDDVSKRIEHLQEARSKILSYTPGSLMGKANKEQLHHFNVPETTTLLLIGPRGSGKSSLVNKLSRMFEDDVFAPERAQVSYNASVGDGTCFIQEYMIPRGSSSFCVYDTRSLSDKTYENLEELQDWMTKGIRHGEPVWRFSDNMKLKADIRSKARQCGHRSSNTRRVNFVIFVVNGLSIMEAIYNDNEETRSYTKKIASEFNNPLLSYKDDKPVVVVTHGDLLSIPDRARVRIHLGELFGIPPQTQIFDIPESTDPVTKLSIVDMILYCLERADRNLPHKDRPLDKIRRISRFALYFLLVVAVLNAIVSCITSSHTTMSNGVDTPTPTLIDWNAIRHLWLGSEYD